MGMGRHHGVERGLSRGAESKITLYFQAASSVRWLPSTETGRAGVH